MKSLVVDDDSISRTSLRAHLMRHGSCDAVATGEEALTAFDNGLQQGSPYQVICLDIEMPGMDGQEVLREIRMREERHGATVPAKVIMTSAHSEVEQVKASFYNRSDTFLVKPVGAGLLDQRLQRLGLLPAAGEHPR